MAGLRAATLLPSWRIVSGFGPMPVVPAAAQASANSELQTTIRSDRQVALDRAEIAGKMRSATDPVAFVSFEPVQRQFVFLCPYRDCFQTEFVGRAEHANSNIGRLATRILEMGTSAR